MTHFTGKDRLYCTLHPTESITKSKQKELSIALAQLADFKPIQHLTGKAFFSDDVFKVSRDTLIPRPETAELVDWIINDHQENHQGASLKILDIGTGSGCIAVSLAKAIKEATLWGLDRSKKALKIARQNAAAHQVNIHWVQADIFAAPPFSESFNVIVSNPPYLRLSEQKDMPPNVLNHEPASALFVADESPLCFYECIADFAGKYLREGGQLYFEINEAFGKEVQALLTQKGFEQVCLKQDFLGKDRMVKAVKPLPFPIFAKNKVL